MNPYTRAEIDLAAIAHNVAELRRVTAARSRFMAVVKADAYGHGAVAVAQTALTAGADALGVARLGEGRQLRQAGITAPVLVFGYTPPRSVADLLQSNLVPTVFDMDTARAYSQAATQMGRRLPVHLKVDTGMGRLGFPLAGPECKPAQGLYTTRELVTAIEVIGALPGLEIEGIYTHFASADHTDKTDTREQAARFAALLLQLTTKGIHIPVKHAANSAAIIDLPETHLDMVRAGIALYGLYPSRQVGVKRVALRPAMAFKSQIIQIKSVPAGFRVSYGGTYTTPKPTTIAAVPVGYADGYSRGLSSKGHMLVKGRHAPVIGRVCMDLTMLDVGHIAGAAIGDEVVVFGQQGDAVISADDIAESLGTINYEVVSTIMARVPRRHLS
jgi:alanine racemase